MIVIVGNQKGGPGKSTVTLLLAHYLAETKKKLVTVIDMDYQQSISQMYERAKLLENVRPYEVIAASLEQYNLIKPVLCENPLHIIIIDLPGKIDDDGLIPVFATADLVICPFAYDPFSFDSTILFSVVLKKINTNANIVYIPNRVKAKVRYQTRKEVDLQLRTFGEVSEALPDRIDFQRTTTFYIPEVVGPLILPVFNKIYNDHLAFLFDDQNLYNDEQ